MKPVTFAVCFSAAIAVCMAELCMISPRQRGSMLDLNKSGSLDCNLTKGPCGGRTAERPVGTFKTLGSISAIIQKNRDCFARATPGYFTMSLWKGTETVASLTRVDDTVEPSLSLYTISSLLPSDVSPGNYTLQVEYVTNNDLTPPIFYQCSDIMLV